MIETLRSSIVSCTQCPRLRNHCQKIALVKRKSYRHETYWGKPVPGFGDPWARLLIVGLAPGAHGANRTGRVVTGDRSGEWLYHALYKAGFSNQPQSVGINDGLCLSDAYVTCIIKCAPPENKPLPTEINHCQTHLIQELTALKNVHVIVALGEVAFKTIWTLLAPQQTIPKFCHGKQIFLNPKLCLIVSYHPSQQNTFTGKLTQPQFQSIFTAAKTQLSLFL